MITSLLVQAECHDACPQEAKVHYDFKPATFEKHINSGSPSSCRTFSLNSQEQILSSTQLIPSDPFKMKFQTLASLILVAATSIEGIAVPSTNGVEARADDSAATGYTFTRLDKNNAVSQTSTYHPCFSNINANLSTRPSSLSTTKSVSQNLCETTPQSSSDNRSSRTLHWGISSTFPLS
jgi:hypothetical protein